MPLPIHRSFATLLDRCRPRVDPLLVPSAAWQRLRSLGERLPAELSARFYLECHLGGGGGWADLILAVDEPGREILRGANPAVRLEGELRREPIWARLAGLCRRLREEPWLGALVHRPWIEFDLPRALGDGAHPVASGPVPGALPRPGGEKREEQDERVAPPGLFLELERRPRRPPVPAAGEEPLLGLLDAWLEPSAMRPARRHLRACRDRGAGTLPLYALGLFPARGCRHLRSCLYAEEVLAESGVLDPLLGGAGGRRVRRRLERLEPPTDRPPQLLHVEVDGAGRGPLGLEWRLPSARDGTPRPVARSLLAAVGESGLADRARLEALLRWPGAEVDRLPHQLWPSVVRRSLNHLKLVARPDGGIDLKAYLLCVAAPRRSDRARPLSV